MEKNLLKFDIMLGGRFFCTMTYRFCPAFAVTQEELEAFAEKHHPFLKHRKYTIAL